THVCGWQVSAISFASSAAAFLLCALNLLNNCYGLFRPFIALVTEANALKHYLAICADDPIARNAVNTKAFGKRLPQNYRESVFVLFHKRLDESKLIINVERQHQYILVLFHLFAQLLHIRQFRATRSAPRCPQV